MDEKAITELVNKAVENATNQLIQKFENLSKNGNNTQNNQEKNEDVDYLQRTKEQLAIEEQEKAKVKEIEDTAKFNLQIKDFLEDNAELLPKNCKDIYENINNANIGSSLEKRQEIQRSIIISTFENKDAFNSLIGSQQEKIKNFMTLTIEAQRKQASAMWEILDTYLDKAKYAKQQQKLMRINSGLDVSDDTKSRIQEGFNKAYKFFFGSENTRPARIVNK